MLRMKLRAGCKKLGMQGRKFWQSSLASSFIYPNDPPRALFIWRNDGYLVFRRDTGGKMVVQPKISRKLQRKKIVYIFCNF
jgi:hypothetical protein